MGGRVGADGSDVDYGPPGSATSVHVSWSGNDRSRADDAVDGWEPDWVPCGVHSYEQNAVLLSVQGVSEPSIPVGGLTSVARDTRTGIDSSEGRTIIGRDGTRTW